MDIDSTVLGFIDDGKPTTLSLPANNDSTNSTSTFVDSSLAAFLARPVRLSSETWTLDAEYSKLITPWDLFALPSIKSKLSNYSLMSATVHIKVIINASPFHYSLLVGSVLPLPLTQTGLNVAGYADRKSRVMRATMLPHSTTSIRDNTTLEYELPFIYPTSYIHVADAVTPTEDVHVPWHLNLTSVMPLRAASATATAGCNVTVLAWATDVELSISTVVPQSAAEKVSSAANSFFDMQRRAVMVKEATQDGTISTIASAASDFLEPLTKIPLLGPIAEVGQTIADVGGAIASFFGFARPPIESAPVYIKARPYTSTALVIGGETVEKLSLDPKQGVNIAPSTVGTSNVDEMSLVYMRSIAPVFSTVVWNDTFVVDQEIFYVDVNPQIYLTEPYYGGNLNIMSPLMSTSIPFRQWTGSIVYRFQVISSTYHNCRLRVAWEPNGDATTGDYNVSHGLIFDINQVRDFEVTVPWGQARNWQDMPIIPVQQFTPHLKNYDPECSNGRLSVSVVNELVSPEGSAPVSIVVSVRAGSDFQTAVPDGNTIGSYTFAPMPEAQSTGNLVAPNSFHLFGESKTAQAMLDQNATYVGENIISMRSLLKRYSPLDGFVATVTNTQSRNAQVTHDICDTLICTGATQNGVNYDAATQFNNHRLTLLEFTSNQYLFRKGAYRYKYSVQNSGINSHVGQMSIVRSNLDMIHLPEGATHIHKFSSANEYNPALFDVPDHYGFSGYVITEGDIQPTFEVEFPYYNSYKFYQAQSITGSNDPAYGSPKKQAFLTYNSTVETATNFVIDRHVSTGEDFNLYFYTGLADIYDRNY